MITPIKSLIDQSLRKLGAISAGDQPDAAEYADALDALKSMLDGWSLEDLLVPFWATEQFTLSPTQNRYSMGSGGDWDTVRPERIDYVRIIDAGGNAYPVQPTTPGKEQWQATVPAADPSRFMTNADARFTWVEFNSYPLSTVALVTSLKPFNAPAIDNFDLEYDPNADASTIYPSGFTLTGISTTIEFPSGYLQAIIYNLAVHLAPEYPGITLPEVVVAMAANSKRLIKRRNSKPRELRFEWALQHNRAPRYDIQSGTYL